MNFATSPAKTLTFLGAALALVFRILKTGYKIKV